MKKDQIYKRGSQILLEGRKKGDHKQDREEGKKQDSCASEGQKKENI